MGKELLEGREIEERVDSAMVKMLSRYQGLIISVLGSFMIFVLSQMYTKISLVFTDSAKFNLYMHRNEDQMQLLKTQILELKQTDKERLQEIRALEGKQNLHEKESAQRWSYFLRGQEDSNAQTTTR